METAMKPTSRYSKWMQMEFHPDWKRCCFGFAIGSLWERQRGRVVVHLRVCAGAALMWQWDQEIYSV